MRWTHQGIRKWACWVPVSNPSNIISMFAGSGPDKKRLLRATHVSDEWTQHIGEQIVARYPNHHRITTKKSFNTSCRIVHRAPPVRDQQHQLGDRHRPAPGLHLRPLQLLGRQVWKSSIGSRTSTISRQTLVYNLLWHNWMIEIYTTLREIPTPHGNS